MKISRNDFKLSFTDVEFHTTVSKKTGKTVITCTLKGYINQPMIDDGETFAVIPYWGGDEFESTLTRTFASTAKATCSVKDKNDERIGQAVAQAKAESKCYAAVRKLLHDRVTTGCAVLISALMRFEEKSDAVIAHNKTYIDRVSTPGTENNLNRLAI